MILGLAVVAGGGLGAFIRYYSGILINSLHSTHFPYSTLFVNVVGSFLIGFLMELPALKSADSLELRAFLVTGILGGFTTFSAFSLDVIKLIDSQQYSSAGLYVLSSLGVSLLAIFISVYIARGIFG